MRVASLVLTAGTLTIAVCGCGGGGGSKSDAAAKGPTARFESSHYTGPGSVPDPAKTGVRIELENGWYSSALFPDKESGSTLVLIMPPGHGDLSSFDQLATLDDVSSGPGSATSVLFAGGDEPANSCDDATADFAETPAVVDAVGSCSGAGTGILPTTQVSLDSGRIRLASKWPSYGAVGSDGPLRMVCDAKSVIPSIPDVGCAKVGTTEAPKTATGNDESGGPSTTSETDTLSSPEAGGDAASPCPQTVTGPNGEHVAFWVSKSFGCTAGKSTVEALVRGDDIDTFDCRRIQPDVFPYLFECKNSAGQELRTFDASTAVD